MIAGSDRWTRYEGNQVVLAVNAYQELHHSYPDNLKELIPAFLPHRPITFNGAIGTIVYVHLPPDPHSCQLKDPPCRTQEWTALSYMSWPPFGDEVYDFNHPDKGWWFDG